MLPFRLNPHLNRLAAGASDAGAGIVEQGECHEVNVLEWQEVLGWK